MFLEVSRPSPAPCSAEKGRKEPAQPLPVHPVWMAPDGQLTPGAHAGPLPPSAIQWRKHKDRSQLPTWVRAHPIPSAHLPRQGVRGRCLPAHRPPPILSDSTKLPLCGRLRQGGPGETQEGWLPRRTLVCTPADTSTMVCRPWGVMFRRRRLVSKSSRACMVSGYRDWKEMRCRPHW